jgi:hypothetical protein
MIKTLIETFTHDILLKAAKSIQKNDPYLIVYQDFIQYFKNINELSNHNTIIGISFVYSWMPTILEVSTVQIDKATKILNKAKQGIRPCSEELEILKKCFNNSLVGGSKLLHFINPEKFAIWDSRVYRYLHNQEPHSYRVENKDTYLEYLSFCDHLLKDSIRMTCLQKKVEEKIGDKITKMRAIELILFYNGAKIKST